MDRREGDTFKNGTDQFWNVCGPDGGAIAHLFWHFNHVTPVAEDEANARLMAAAPDLLAVCELILDLEDSGAWAGPSEVIAPLRLAIAKATGTDAQPTADEIEAYRRYLATGIES